MVVRFNLHIGLKSWVSKMTFFFGTWLVLHLINLVVVVVTVKSVNSALYNPHADRPMKYEAKAGVKFVRHF